MLQAAYAPYRLALRFEARTSRAIMHHKDTYFIKIWDDSEPEIAGIGECALFRGLSADDVPDYESRLSQVCRNIVNITDLEDIGLSSIIFGVETAMADLLSGGKRIVRQNRWSNGDMRLQINGLVWMADRDTMLKRIQEKLSDGFKCLKLKIGGIAFHDELELLRSIRENFSPDELEIRLDANGAFLPSEATGKLDALSEYYIHSIEQPIKAGQIKEMSDICRKSPIPVALDEELIGCRDYDAQSMLLDAISPQFIIIKPSLCGGLSASSRWISLARQKGIGWWATSAMESNIGLNAIAQWVANFNPKMPQGLGTGQIYENNITSPIRLASQWLSYDSNGNWEIPELEWLR